MLPATKSQPKEMLPVVDTPVIEYVVEEAVASGITDILMIIGKGKRAIEEHFDRNWELEQQLAEQGKEKLLKRIRRISNLADIHFVWQKELNGLGDAIRYARYHVGNEAFAVLLGDSIVESDSTPVTAQLMKVFDRYQDPVIALEEVPMEMVSRYGILKGKEISENLWLAEDWVEKPSQEVAPSRLAIAGRYIFTAEIFDYLDQTQPGLHQEIQLADAMRAMLRDRAMYGLRFEGRRHDVGNTLDFIKANVHFGLKKEGTGPALREWLRSLDLE